MILQALCGYYQRLASNPNSEVAANGYAPTNVTACIVLDREGNVTAVDDLRVLNGKKLQPRSLSNVPLQPKRSGVRPEAAFLCENVAFIFGIHEKVDAAQYRFEASHQKHEQILAEVDDAGAQALLAFFTKRRHGSYVYEGVDTTPLENGGNIVFRIQGDNVFLHQRSAIREAWERANEKKDAEALWGQCLVTGIEGPIARLHGNMGGFGQDKPTLVGFNQDAFESFGKHQGANAPVSTRAAFQYVTALNSLIADRRHSTNLHGERVLFWAERDVPIQETFLAFYITGDEQALAPEGGVLDEAASQEIRATLNSLLEGKSPRDLCLDPDVLFYLLGCTTNKTRLVIRFFYRSTFGDLLDKLRQHYEDVKISGAVAHPSLYSILRETAVLSKSENVPAPLKASLLRSIFEGSSYPIGLYTAILQRIRAEAADNAFKAINATRIGVLKGYLNRVTRRDKKKGEMHVALNIHETNEGYLLGRVFALLEKAQYDALGQLNATVVDKYLNAALATPQAVFPTLLLLVEKHLSKSGKYYAKNLIGEILAQMSSQGFPKTLSAEDQGRFLIGYYHQKYSYLNGSVENEDEKEKAKDFEENGGMENV